MVKIPLNHRKINYILTALVVAMAVYILAMPLLPAVTYKINKAKGFAQPQYVTDALNNQKNANIPQENRLAIPSIGLDKEIFEGSGYNTLDKGLWYRPNTGNPANGGNFVIVGHRFMYTGDASQVFYNLDKVNVGDSIVIFWQQKGYKYKITSKEVVSPLALEVEAQTKEDKLTLYTCTPLWTNHKRLVVVALLNKEQ